MKIPPSIPTTKDLFTPQELEYFKKMKALKDELNGEFFVNQLSPPDISALISKLQSVDNPRAQELTGRCFGMIPKFQAISLFGEALYSTNAPNNFMSRFQMISMANQIDEQMGEVTDGAKHQQDTFGKFSKFQMCVEIFPQFVDQVDVTNLDKVLTSPDAELLPSGTLDQVLDGYDALIVDTNAAGALMDSLTAKVKEFQKLLSLKSMFNFNPSFNYLLGGDILKNVPGIAHPKVIELMKIPPKF